MNFFLDQQLNIATLFEQKRITRSLKKKIKIQTNVLPRRVVRVRLIAFEKDYFKVY